jgi:xeroderma pigmentosum group C-complementing protein
MPPHVPRKRLREPSSPGESPRRNSRREKRSSSPNHRKSTLYDDLDATSTPQHKHTDSILQEISDSEAESPLTSLSDADFEDVPLTKRARLEECSDEDDDVEFEDVEAPEIPDTAMPALSGDLELTLHRDTRISLANAFGKKGPSKLERRIRYNTHCVNVQLLLWHNSLRNSWLCDEEVQAIMMSHIPPRIWDEVDRWQRSSCVDIDKTEQLTKKDVKGKGKSKDKKKAIDDRKSRDWGSAAERLENGVVDMSHGDPLFRLMKCLVAWWRQRFKVTSAGIRKIGYMSLELLDRYTKEYTNSRGDPDQFGERIRNLGEFRERAQTCTGSRDVGAQLFTALLRALGLEARMVASLQPLGFGWTKYEDADQEKDPGGVTGASRSELYADEAKDSPPHVETSKKSAKKKSPIPGDPSGKLRPTSSKRINKSVKKEDILTIEDEDSDIELVHIQTTPRKMAQSKKFDQDLEFPHYWTEVLSPVTHKYLVVDPIVKHLVATNRDLIESLEPKGAKADRTRQVMAYVVGFARDGTAKDVTVRYLKRQTLPGRTKGMRIPLEKIPVYNKHGKVARYDHFDWFKFVMKGYSRGTQKHPITEVDEAEDSTDLRPNKPEKKEIKEGQETLQYYKTSKEFVLERHLKREEALLPNAAPVKTFRNKGKAGEGEEMVYLRSDVVQVKSAETWHKQGRVPVPGEAPLKRVPYRAATINRRREIAEAEAASGEKVLQGLYSFDQTDWIIPPPIQNGIIPKNEYGYERICKALP